jgi:hypothetical protein
MNQTISVSGFPETLVNLKQYGQRMQQNIERKAMRQTMQRFRKWEKRAWKDYPIEKSSLEWGKGKIRTYKSGRTKMVTAYSIRKDSAKAVTVKVGTRRPMKGVLGWDVYGRVFLRYSKKGASHARLAHFLEMDRKGHAGKYRIATLYRNTWRTLFRTFAKAMDIYVSFPSAKSSAVREQLF